jgi:hypothetical protein
LRPDFGIIADVCRDWLRAIGSRTAYVIFLAISIPLVGLGVSRMTTGARPLAYMVAGAVICFGVLLLVVMVISQMLDRRRKADDDKPCS